ncbi:protein kinase [Candidatus Omnitrophota bacterium]
MAKTLLANRYRILEKLGAGGMGIVWKVYDTVEHRAVAMKQFFRKSATPVTAKTAKAGAASTTAVDSNTSLTVTGPEVRQTLEEADLFATTAAQTKRVKITTATTSEAEVELRFKQEFRTMVKLKHPNTVHVYEFGVLENGDTYITMEIVPGRELRDILKEKQLTIPEVYRILIQTAQVLNFIHSRLLVHRDIKPDNIRITPEGNVKMMDFGLMEQMGLPSTGEISGTPLYLPPEVPKGGAIDGRSDLYSLGIMVYEITTGKLPFMGKTILEIIKKHIEERPLAPRKIRKNIPEALEKVILKLLAKNPDNRYQTTAELINDLIKITGEDEFEETIEQRKSYLSCSELIGREKEMQRLKEFFRLSKKDKGQGIFIAAPAGTGKSRLIQDFQLDVQLDGVPFVQGKCFEQGMLPYQPITEAFKSLLPLTSKKLIDKYGSVLVKVIPELKNKGYQPVEQLEAYAEKARLFESVVGWLKEVAEVQPLVIYIEDLHWADIPSIDLLNVCIQGLRESPIMILCSFRDDEVEDTNRIFQTVKEKLTHEIKLSPLSTVNVNILITKMLGHIKLTPDFTEHLYAFTGGNPFFVIETMRALIEEERLKLKCGRWILPAEVGALELPSSIEATILRRLKLLSPEVSKIAKVAAVVGRNLNLSFLKALSDVEDEELFNALDELIERQFMKTEGKQYTFTHDRVRETLYAQLDEKTCRQIHEKAGTIIERRFSENKQPVINELAYHFSHGLNKPKAVDYLILAGDTGWKIRDYFRATKSWAEALRILEAISYPNKKTVMFHLRDKLLDTSAFTDPAYCAQVSEDQFQELNKLVNVKRVVQLMRIIFKIIDVLPKRIGLKIKERLTKQAPKEKIDKDFGTIILFMVRAHGWGSLAEFFRGNYKRSLELIDQADDYLPDMNGLGYSAVVAGYFPTLVYLGRTKDAIERGKRAFRNMDIAERYVGLTDWFYKYIYGSYFVYLNLPDVELGKNFKLDFPDRGLCYNEKENFLDLVWWYHCGRCQWLSWRGMYKEFQRKSDIVQELSRKLGRPAPLDMWYYCYRAKIEVSLHNYDNALQAVEKVYTLGKQTGSSYIIQQAEMIKAFLKFVQGNKKEGVSQMEHTVRGATESNFISAPEAMGFLAEMYIELDNIEQAQLILNRAEDFSKQKLDETPVVAQATIYLLRSEVMRKKKELEKAKSILNEVLKISEETDNPLLKGSFHQQLAKINMDLTQYNKAKDNLREAEKIFEGLGAENRKREVLELLKTIEA